MSLSDDTGLYKMRHYNLKKNGKMDVPQVTINTMADTFQNRGPFY